MVPDRLSVAIVIPAFNEQDRLSATLEELTGFLQRQPWTWEIRIVDDGSTDDTCRVAEEWVSRVPGDPKVPEVPEVPGGFGAKIVLQREPHRGKGGAVKAGLLAATAPFRFICDADLSMPVTELPRFLPPALDGFDIAIGSREGHGARRVGEPMLRHLAGRAFNYAVQRLMVPGIEDTQCGFKMFTARAVEAIFPLVRVEGWAFDIEVLYAARQRGFRIVEVPIEWHYRRASRLSLVSDGADMFRELLRIRRRAARGDYG